jgi:hypothetical protein
MNGIDLGDLRTKVQGLIHDLKPCALALDSIRFSALKKDSDAVIEISVEARKRLQEVLEKLKILSQRLG